MAQQSTLEWFGTTTFRLRTPNLTIFLDAWLQRPPSIPQHLSVNEVTEADYIFISHAHFDHLPGASELALRTGAIVVANSTAISCLERAGVPSNQLLQVAGGERIPLFTRAIREAARSGTCALAPGPPGAPPLPHPSLAVVAAHCWPSLHCLIPASPTNMPATLDTGLAYPLTPEQKNWGSTLDVNRGMIYGLLAIGDYVPAEQRDGKLQTFVQWLEDVNTHRGCFSGHDGGQLMFNFVLPEDKVEPVEAALAKGEAAYKTLLWQAHLGAYEGIVRNMKPKPDVAILGAAGRPNHDGRPFVGTAAEFLREEVNWLDKPKRVVWCLHDECPVKPFTVDVKVATELVEKDTARATRVLDMTHAKLYPIFPSH
ncbi:hypothetical protein K469DRAFT_693043 [Zopfia rhizophila CBS 207.26]|uniref:Metallo-beta-lactamase domain-containing protein n=1 Tax=Zopfia rhizophila CBS 207.26 TaxID=1314779 RepID=A0A6A6EMZ8_9PEZI|nr:hypothetical protein K469DRAFT_693043 [Zopfia rhizophila CBS 207.26]